MPKKVVKTKTIKKISPRKIISITSIEKILIENFVSLQKVMVNMSSKFDNLAKQMSKLLELFEVSAKTLAERELDLDKKENKKIMEKIDNLIEQNKIIARGLSLMHERIAEEPSYPEAQIPPQMPPAQKLPPPQRLPSTSPEMKGYQKSIV